MAESSNQPFCPPHLSWRDSFGWGLCLIVLYLLIAAAPVVFAMMDTPASDEPVRVDMALAAALFGFSLIGLQVLLAGRFKTIDRPFGLDVLMRFHKRMGVVALLLVLSHPLLLAWGHQSTHLLTFDTGWQVNLGKAALLVLLLGVLFALFFPRLGVDYNVWRFMHKGMMAVVLLGFWHSWAIGPDIQGGLTRTYWVAIFAVTALVFGYRNLVVPVWGRRRFTVSDVHRETHDTYTLTFEPEDGKPTFRNPGQFMFVKLIRPGRPSELHPFTISASPLKPGLLQASIKQSGNFTNTIDRTKPGDIAKIEAPFGRFSVVYHNPAKVLCIAGGVGLTPIMSMLRYLRETQDTRPVTLLYGNKTEKDILFRTEIDTLPDNFKTVHILSRPDNNWPGEQGYITADIIEKYAADVLADAHIYVCGPPVMMDKINKALHHLNVSEKRTHYERFTI